MASFRGVWVLGAALVNLTLLIWCGNKPSSFYPHDDPYLTNMYLVMSFCVYTNVNAENYFNIQSTYRPHSYYQLVILSQMAS